MAIADQQVHKSGLVTPGLKSRVFQKLSGLNAHPKKLTIRSIAPAAHTFIKKYNQDEGYWQSHRDQQSHGQRSQRLSIRSLI